jgi:hypothetical protein
VVIPKVDPRRNYALFTRGNLAQEVLYQKDENKLFTHFKNNMEQQFQYGSIDIIVSIVNCYNYRTIRMNVDKKGVAYQLKLYTYHQKELDKQIKEYLRGGNFAFKTTLSQDKFNELKSLLTPDTSYRSTLTNSITLKQGNNYFNISDNNPEAKIHTFIAKLAEENNCYRLY